MALSSDENPGVDVDNARVCPICAASDATRWAAYSPEGWDVVQCKGCGLTYLRNPANYGALEESFAWEKTYRAKKASGKGSTPLSGTSKKLRAWGRKLKSRPEDKMATWFKNGAVLDIGCGSVVRVAEPMTPYGIELGREAHAISDAIMRERGGFCLHGAGAEAIWDFEPDMFDGVVMNSYLEHETDVLGVLKGCWRAMKPGALAYVRVPNFASLNRKIVGPKWCGFRYPDHVNYFTLATLREAGKRAGFTLKLQNPLNLAFDDNIKVLFQKSQVPVT